VWGCKGTSRSNIRNAKRAEYFETVDRLTLLRLVFDTAALGSAPAFYYFRFATFFLVLADRT